MPNLPLPEGHFSGGAKLTEDDDDNGLRAILNARLPKKVTATRSAVSVGAGLTVTPPFTVPGVALGDVVACHHKAGGLGQSKLLPVVSHVTSPNEVFVSLHNHTPNPFGPSDVELDFAIQSFG